MLLGCHLKVAVVLWTLCVAVINTPTKVHALQSAKT